MRLSLFRALALAAAVSLAPAVALAQIVVVVPAVRVTVAPPPLRVEAQPAAPSAGHVWIPGHWVWRGGQHEWALGHWALPPEPGYTWEAARWVSEGGQWVFYEGHWRVAAAAPAPVIYQPTVQPVVIETAPPAPLVEVRPAEPYSGAVWIPGYWYWHGNRHFWVGGRYSAPHPGHVWEPHRWERDGGHWRFVVGRWR
jgi:WXXGXW repeat (2 copies)